MCMVTDNIRLVGYTLNKYFSIYRNTSKWDDLYQEGCVGLIKANKDFDSSLGYAFSTYAISKIYSQIKQYLRSTVSILKIPRSDFEAIQKINAVLFKYGEVDIEIIAQKTNLKVDKINALIDQVILPVGSLEFETGRDNNCLLSNIVADSRDDYKEILEKDHINWLLKYLTETERKVVIMYYIDDMNQQEIAKALNTNQTQISRYLTRAKKKINGDVSIVRTGKMQQCFKLLDDGLSKDEVTEKLELTRSTANTYYSRWKRRKKDGGREEFREESKRMA